MRFLLFVLLFVAAIAKSEPNTVIRLVPGQSDADTRHVFPHKVLRLALDATVSSDGPYKIEYSRAHYTRDRALIELQTGNNVNVHHAPTREEWEKQAIPVYIPIRKGLLGYRLLLVNEKTQSNLDAVESLDDLKSLYAGLGEQWSITKVMDALGFNIVTGNNYEGLFTMLMAGRFDYFPRGLNEVFKEYKARKATYAGMKLEPNLALYIPSPSYFFVSPATPLLADRIERGLNKIIGDGTFDIVFQEEFGADIELANLRNRKIFRLNNPLLSPQTPSEVESYWLKL